MTQESAWRLFWETGLVEAWLLTRVDGRAETEQTWQEAKTAFLPAAPQKQKQ